MLQKSVLLIVAVGASLTLAAEFLGVVPNSAPEDLAARYTIVGVTGHGVLVLSDNARDGDFAALHGRFLAENPKAHLYYTVRLFADASRADLAAVSRILDFDGEQYLVEVEPDAVERFIAVPAMRGRISLNGWMMDRPAPKLPRVLADPTIEQIVARVSPDSVLEFVGRLQEYGNRYSTGDSCKAAAQWIAAKFQAYGCDTVFFQNHTTDHAPNVVGIRYGVSGARQPYAIIDGHFDSYHPYATQARSQGDSILGVLNFDMIGYVDASPENLDMLAKIANPPCGPFAQWFAAIADTYAALPCSLQMVSDNQNSDHGPFWNNGYLAFCGIEDFWPTNPYYHTPADSIGAGYNNDSFCTQVIRAGVAGLATLGEPVPVSVQSNDLLNIGLVSAPRLMLEQNPVRGNARIHYVLPQASSVKLEAFDRSGRRISTLTSGYSSAGAHSATWDARNVPAGIYFLRLTAASGQRSLKAVVGR